MKLLYRIPLLLPFGAFATGILLKSIWIGGDAGALVMVGLMVAGWWIVMLRMRGVFRRSIMPWGLLGLSMFCFGYLWLEPVGLSQADLVVIPEDSPIELAGVLEKPLKFSPKGRTGLLLTYSRRTEDDAWRLEQRRMKFFVKDTSTSFEVGDTVFLKGRVKPIETKSASYQAYLDKQGLEYMLFAWEFYRGNTGKSWRLHLLRMQKKLSRHWDEFCEDKTAASLAKAMFLGYKQDIKQETKERFATAGFSHLLAISGLHVGILFVLLSSLTRAFRGTFWGRMASTFFLIGALVLFSLLTGASASVIRASNMLGVYLLVRLVHQRIHPLNVLALCGLLQLIWAPEDLLTVGFQLSYLAVGMLLVVLPIYAKWVKTPWPWLNRIYELIGVNILATAATAPLVWYYFGSFPTYFLPANLIVAPLLFLLVFSGFLAVILSIVYLPLAVYPAWLSEKGLQVLDFVALKTTDLPYAKLEAFQAQEVGWGILILQLLICLIFITLPKIVSFVKREFSEKWQKSVV
ncbi:MAG: ComEC/Rec2 family competence protein [Bacteroidota bacterium]